MATRLNTTSALNPSRRTALQAFGGLATALTTGAMAAAAPDPRAARWQETIRGLSWAHPNGRRVAEAAMAAGVDPADLSLIILRGFCDKTKDHRPTLMFDVNGTIRTFEPAGEVVR